MQTTAVVIGAGHAGLTMSRRLTDRSIDHVVLERGEAARCCRSLSVLCAGGGQPLVEPNGLVTVGAPRME
jgi:flavin-dependent dehydrogenase